MVTVLEGESGWQQWWNHGSKKGQVVRGIVDPDDTGVCQINKRYWGAEAIEMGLDIDNSIEDNMVMCRHIYDTQGITAWVYYNDHIAMR